MLTFNGWLMIVFLSSGGVSHARTTKTMLDCLAQARFEERHDPSVSRAVCIISVAMEV